VVPNLVLKTMGIMCQVRRTFKVSDDSYQDLAQFVGLRVSPDVIVLSAMAVRCRA
jgi:hypothetical protein